MKMSERSEKNRPDDILAWQVLLSSGTATVEDHHDFKAWLEVSSENRAAYEEVQHVFRVYDALWADEQAPEEMFDVGDAVHASAPPYKLTRWFVPVAIAACLLLVVGGATLFSFLNVPKAPYVAETTAVGEQRALLLADGSTVYLNTDTKIEYSLSDSQRNVKVLNGEAFFEIAKDPAAPFTVVAGSRGVRVIGTAFNVRFINGVADVTVTEGAVGLTDPEQNARTQPAVRLEAGMAATYTASSIKVQPNIELEAVKAWRYKKLFYQNASLSHVVRDLNRYFSSEFKTVGEAAENLRVTLILNLEEEEILLNTLSKQLPIRIQNGKNNTRIISVLPENSISVPE